MVMFVVFNFVLEITPSRLGAAVVKKSKMSRGLRSAKYELVAEEESVPKRIGISSSIV